MGAGRGQAWVTFVSDDNSVTCALIFVEALRRTKTTRRIAAIISNNVSKSGSSVLRKAFDDTFLLDNNLISPKIGKQFAGKIFAFSLRVYRKCIFVEPTIMILENCDHLFGSQPGRFKKFGKNWEMFLFAPNIEICEFMAEQYEDSGSQGFGENVAAWFQEILPKDSNNLLDWIIEEFVLMKFSAKSGRIHIYDESKSLAIQMCDLPERQEEIVKLLKSLVESNTSGFLEKSIARDWLNIFDKHIATRLNDPIPKSIKTPTGSGDIYENEPIAIVGISCRFPGANNLDEFWNLLYSEMEGVRNPPSYRWKKEHSIFASHRERETNAGFLSVPIDEFDFKFFGISPKEAVFLDPQTRLLHEVLWESLENAGIDPLALRNTHTGIFTGSWMNDYKDIVQASTERDFFRTYMGNSIGASAARLSFLLGLTGPCIATESGCSSAIVAVDMAVKSLRIGETNLALAGGVNLLLHPFIGDIIEYVISPDGRCKTFDEKANGFGRAEGCGVLALKRLSDAQKDGDHIWAVIRGSAITQEGLSRSLGTPTVHCEALAMELALKDAGVEPEQVSFVETHGTGTSVGDPMEVSAIAKAYRSQLRREPLIIGSVKTNVGHTESCSGITGIIKTVLAMQHELIPKHLNFDTLNPEIDLEAIPAKIPLEAIPWPKTPGYSRMAGVSSFGITGTDGHVILEEAPAPAISLERIEILERPLHLIKFSAKTKEALEELLNIYENKLDEMDSQESFLNLAYTANVGRASFTNRAFILAADSTEAVTAIQNKKLIKNEEADLRENQKICFLFTGQGSQYVGMAKALYDTNPVFRLHFDRCETFLRNQHKISLVKVLWQETDAGSKELSRTIFSQTAIFCVEYCLLKLWESWGIKPDYVLGHSLGEICAAVAAGVLTFEDALMLVAERSRLIENLPRGSMLVIKACLKDVNQLMKDSNVNLDIAAVNSEDQTVVAGESDVVHKFLEICKSKGLKAVLLEATHAFHSRYMEPMLGEYRKIGESIRNKSSAKCQYISGLEGKLLEDPCKEINADYWVRHTRHQVSFLQACNTLNSLDCQYFLEIGAQPVLSTFVLQNTSSSSITCFPSLRRNAEDWQTILTSLGKLYLAGFTVDWHGFDKPYPNRRKIPESLPFHPFHRKSFWVDCSNVSMAPIHPLIGSPFKNASNLSIFQNTITAKVIPWLKDHCVGNRVVLPGAAYAEMCLSAGYSVANCLTDVLEVPQRPMALENLKIDAPLELKEGEQCRVQIVVNLDDTEQQELEQQQGFQVKIFHQCITDNEVTGKWVQHCSATFNPVANTQTILSNYQLDRARHIYQTTEPNSTAAFYKRVDGVGLKFGEAFKSIRNYSGELKENQHDEIIAQVSLPKDFTSFLLHPILIDAMIQAIILSKWQIQTEHLSLPVVIGKLVWLDNISRENNNDQFYVHAFWADKENCHIFALDENFHPVAFMEGVQLIDTTVKTLESVLMQQSRELPDSWEETWKTITGPLDRRVKHFEIEPIVTGPVLRGKLDAVDEVVAVEDLALIAKIDRLVYLYSMATLLELGWNPKSGDSFSVIELSKQLGILSAHHQLVHYYLTMFEQENSGMLQFSEETETWSLKAVMPNAEQISQEISQLTETAPTSEDKASFFKIYLNIGAQLGNILRGKISPLQVLFPSESTQTEASADVFYQKYPGRDKIMEKVHIMLEQFLISLQEVNTQNPKRYFRVLEVGGGTGSGTEKFLDILNKTWGNKFEYYFTDISASFFTKAEKRFEANQSNLKFTTFNLEEPALEQGIPLEYFDIVIAFDVLHATKNLEECLGNLRQTLSPEGNLMFIETVSEDRGMTFVFGLLEGYWRFEDFQWRRRHSCVSYKDWDQLLRKNGFNYTHCEQAFTSTCIISATSTSEGLSSFQGPKSEKQWVYFADASQSKEIGKNPKFFKQLGLNNVTLIVQPQNNVPFELGNHLDIANLYGIVYAWGLNQDTRDQKEIALPFLQIAQKIMTLQKPPKLYVLTRGLCHVSDTTSVTCNPSAATLIGMAKSLKNEMSELFLRCVDLDGEQLEDLGLEIAQIRYELASNRIGLERELMLVVHRGDQRFEPKFSQANVQLNLLQLPPSSKRYRLVLPASRMLNDVSYDILEEEHVDENQLEVATKAYALNFRDILTILKPTPTFEKLNAVGLDFAGVVTKVGVNIKPEEFQVGDRVCGIITKDAQLPSHTVIEKENLMKIPEHLTFGEASTLPAVFATSVYCLLKVAKLQKTDTVLIHTGSGGVGLSAIDIAQQIGANIITTAGSARKRTYLRNLGIKHVFHSRNTSYKEEILKVTNGRGVDVVLNSITGPGFKEATLEACAQNARFIEMSKMSVWKPEEVKELRPDVDYNIVDLTVLERSEMEPLIDEIRGNLKEGKIRPIPYTEFDALTIRQALQYFQKARHIGKVVVRMPDVITKEGQWTVHVPLFNAEGVYLVTGGLGGIGFEVCKWMVGKGAKHVVLIGRNPPTKEIAEEIQKLNETKVDGEIAVKVDVKLGDVGNYEQCKRIMEEIVEEGQGKPIRGIHHCAGVLRDSMYANQTWEHFETSLNPKVNGTWNLHNLTLNMPLETFVMYSSLAALAGTPGQPNHAAGNCFEDAFAHYRYSLGLPATCINWGQWSQVGCAKEVSVPGILPVSVKRMLNGLEATLRTQKRQVAFAEFESMHVWTMAVPVFKLYLDEKILKKLKQANKVQDHLLLKSDQFWQEVDEAVEREDKMQVVTMYMKSILRSALRMEADEPISEDANMQDLGVDSLMLIELKNSIQGLLGSKITVTANMMKDCQTIRDLATVIVNKICDEEEGTKNVILPKDELRSLIELDYTLEESIQPTNITPVSVGKTGNILLTGGTGQLGPYILSWLTENRPNCKVYCLVRTREGKCPKEKLESCLETMGLVDKVNLENVECIRGNIVQPNFGIEDDDYKLLCDSVDMIIHLAAKSSHIEQYRKWDKGNSDMRSINVVGTLQVLKFAVTGKTKRLFYSSGISSVLGGNKEGTLCEDWPEASEIDLIVEHGLTGYPTSKYICEMLLKQANERGIPCKVFRFPFILGDSNTGQLNYLYNNYILRFLSYLKLKSMPDAPMPAIVLPVDICAELALQVFFNENAPDEVYNIAHPNPQLELEFVHVAKEHFGMELEIVDWKSKEFVEKLYASDMPLESLRELYEDVDKGISAATSGVIKAISGYLIESKDFFLSRKVDWFVPGYFKNLESSMDIIQKSLTFVKSKGFFSKFGID